MLYVFGDCHVKKMHELNIKNNNIKLIGIEGFWAQSIGYRDLKEFFFTSSVDKNIILFFGHADVRQTQPIYEDIKEKVDKYVKITTKYLKPHFQNVYFAEPWPLWSDSHIDRLTAENYFKMALSESVEKYNTKVVITQKEIYKAIGKESVSSEETVFDYKGGRNWPNEYFEKVLNLIFQKAIDFEKN